MLTCFCLLEIMELKILKGLGLQDIITEVHTYVHRSQYATIVVQICVCVLCLYTCS